ncbi:AB-hydrolase YheT [Coniophora puteana RWD-64-598 SS2]|uniref:AB-hydrolase YheT n=1 Tax=Coniophora puteana (strain RWD-64-598) TaxID=741705 RepID=A0A5M3N2V4_CONPW|nr:AB-hydrolase YheT [Coniophora puteana RWD-64-598 SS2]EIW85205.1 AB-hydrolase YheT [Coniophora puteana RWD-64-598 SS2]
MRRTVVHAPPKPVTVAYKASASEESVSISEFVQRRCPSLARDFVPAWWLFNGHLQTLYSVLGDFTKTDNVIYQRTYLRLQDGGTLGLDFTGPDDTQCEADAPMIVVLHGLTGGSYESYVRAILAPACSPLSEQGLGYRAVVVNFRGCAGVPLTSPQLYSAGHTDDIRQALFYISQRYPTAPLVGVGFSLGANVMTRYVAEEGELSRLRSLCILGCPWDLQANTDKLTSTYLGHHVYSKGMGRNLVNLLRRHVDTLSTYSDRGVAEAAAATMNMVRPTIEAFDSHFTRIAGGSSPPWPFATAGDYYAYASSHKVLGNVQIPFLAINSVDDPVVREIPVGSERSGWVTIAVTPQGGHLGWFEANDKWFEVKRWIRTPVMEWLKATAEDLICVTPSWRPLYTDKDGYIREVNGNAGLGCKEVEGGGIIVGAEPQRDVLAGL